MNRRVFFAGVRKAFGPLTREQVIGFELILDEWQRRKLTNLRWLAYILATAWHETATRMEPVIETRGAKEAANPSVDEAIRRLERAWGAGKMSWVKRAYWRKNGAGLSYLGRGLPQLTHEENYAKIGKLIGEDLVTSPDKALDPAIAIKIMFVGMLLGTFTGKALRDYFPDGAAEGDPTGARRIINGTESARKVAEHYRLFLIALLEAEAAPPEAVKTPSKPEPAAGMRPPENITGNITAPPMPAPPPSAPAPQGGFFSVLAERLRTAFPKKG